MRREDRDELVGALLITAVVIVIALLLTGCAHVRTDPPEPPKEGEPDLSPMVEFVGRFGVAHGCPVGPWAIYTAAHVPDERPFDGSVSLFPQRMQDSAGREDLALPVVTDRAADVALMRPAHFQLSRWFERAQEPPKPGERLWTLGYNREDRWLMFTPRTVRATVVRTIAGHVALTLGARPGSSGACWVNARGEAVAVGVWDLPIDGQQEPAGMAAGLWGSWRFADEGPHAPTKE